jgi:hypothetical protein
VLALALVLILMAATVAGSNLRWNRVDSSVSNTTTTMTSNAESGGGSGGGSGEDGCAEW